VWGVGLEVEDSGWGLKVTGLVFGVGGLSLGFRIEG